MKNRGKPRATVFNFICTKKVRENAPHVDKKNIKGTKTGSFFCYKKKVVFFRVFSIFVSFSFGFSYDFSFIFKAKSYFFFPLLCTHLIFFHFSITTRGAICSYKASNKAF